MKRIICFIFALGISMVLCKAQPPLRAPQVRAEVFPPEIRPDNSVLFKVSAPASTSVGIMVGTQSFRMGRDENGLWSVLTTPLPPGFHYYFLNVDGIQFSDPNSPSYFGYSKESSGIEIPDPGTEVFEIADVPHGTINIVKYFSSVTGSWRELRVYTPAGYATGKAKYPVLYLQHGGGEDQTSWFNQGRAANILDNLIAAGKAVPMIVVCADGKLPSRGGAGGYNWDGMLSFKEEMLDNIIPAVEKQFRVKTDKKSRALCGLSMGGGQSYFVGLRTPEVFGNVGIMSAGVFGGVGGTELDLERDIPGIFTDTKRFNASHEVFFICCGEQDPRIEYTRKATQEMKDHGVNVVFKSYPGDHEWQPWRKALNDFAQMLFK